MKQLLTLAEALRTLAVKRPEAPALSVFLACGFEPLHLATFLKAHLRLRRTDHVPEILAGSYGSIASTLDQACRSDASAAAVVIEWADLDPRLGLRASGGWGQSVQQEIVVNCRQSWRNILAQVERLAARMPVALSPPTLHPPLFGGAPRWQMSAIEAELMRDASAFLADVARIPRVRLVHPARLAEDSPTFSRLDSKLELAAGFPYSLAHASALAGLIATLLYPPAPMKGLITDLDGTLWSGLVGESGVSGVYWSLADGAQVHGLYQQLLRQFSQNGVLLGIASKNDPGVVEEALNRQDLYICGSAFYPVKAGWGAKAQAVEQILQTWNVLPESVVFVDDQPLELELIQAAFPSMTCLRFSSDSTKALALFGELRDLFAKPIVLEEDILRQASIRAASAQPAAPDFIRNLRGRLTFDACKDPNRERLLQLINKTNQFNLNGRRLSDRDWLRTVRDGDTFVLSASYEDKFGPLGVIGVMSGRQEKGRIEVTNWVLSCRAFSRNIEHHMLHFLKEQNENSAVVLAFEPTERNTYLREFFASLGLEVACPALLEITGTSVPAHHLPHEVRMAPSER